MDFPQLADLAQLLYGGSGQAPGSVRTDIEQVVCPAAVAQFQHGHQIIGRFEIR